MTKKLKNKQNFHNLKDYENSKNNNFYKIKKAMSYNFGYDFKNNDEGEKVEEIKAIKTKTTVNADGFDLYFEIEPFDNKGLLLFGIIESL